MADVGDEGNTAVATAAAGTAAGITHDNNCEAAAGGVQPTASLASSRATQSRCCRAWDIELGTSALPAAAENAMT